MTLKHKLLWRNLLPLVAGSLVLTACVSFGAKAPPSLLVLTATTNVQGGAVQTGSPADALIVLLPEVPRKIDTNRVPVQIDDSNVAYLQDAVWADKPARMMQMLLMETVSAKTGRLVLNEVDAGGKAQQFLSGSLMEFGIDSQAMEAVVVYDAVKLVRGEAIEKKRFEARETVTAIEPGPAGIALNRAANRLAAEMAAWVGS
jgi:cholesterol transport system auxiliary component